MCKISLAIYVVDLFNTRTRPDNRIPVALILAGYNVATYSQLFASILQRVELEAATKAVRIPSNQATNLKTILKYINRYATTVLGPSGQNDPDSEAQVSWANFNRSVAVTICRTTDT